MNLTLAGHHLQITPAIREYVNTKLERVARHFDDMMGVNIVLSVEKLQQKIEANIHVRGREIFIEAAHENLYAAIDLFADKLDRQIIKHKEKMVKLFLADILYIEADRNYSHIFTKNKEYMLSITLKHIEDKIPVQQFIRVHRSFIINLAQIDEVAENHVIIGSKAIPLSISAREDLLKRLRTI